MRRHCQINVKRFGVRCRPAAGKSTSSLPFSFQFFTRLAAVFAEEVTQPPSRGRTISGDRGPSLHQTETADLLRKHGGKTGEELKAEGK